MCDNTGYVQLSSYLQVLYHNLYSISGLFVLFPQEYFSMLLLLLLLILLYALRITAEAIQELNIGCRCSPADIVT